MNVLPAPPRHRAEDRQAKVAPNPTVERDARKNSARPPSEQARALWFDCLTHDPQALEFNLRKFGSGRITIGSDYPFAMGVEHPLEQLDGVALTAEDIDNITHKSAEAFLALSV